MSDSEMVMRVAKAIGEHHPKTGECYAMARAAIEAMRVPTDKMIMAALEHAYEHNRDLVIEDWGQMIDAALT